MEIADQWRREWAGSAEYGKVTEGGVTRRIARAMEVLNASGPGSCVRVMRAAYHSSAGPGVPASSYMLHSSRRVISSGYNFLEPPSLPSLPTKPMEISSTPLETFPDSNTDTENYKVTEPDDTEISEPSKWRGSTSASVLRMPSEESSSTDNASIIDLDSRNTKSLQRKYSYDSESSDVPWSRKNDSRDSPLLDAPVTLNTLKYKSLLNGSSEWNNRRKSYSFEDTSALNETRLHQNDNLAMDSSTDSGICKSSEIVNDHNVDDNSHSRYFERKERKSNTQDESFKEWLSKNRSNTFYKGTKFKTYREHDIVIEDPVENSITLQSTGKVSITLPISVETDEAYQQRKLHMNDDSQRKVKKVEFCKTELHFAAESGKVNIIATDEKPPPSNDFRKRRSAFVPLHDIIEKPITLFGEKNNDLAEHNQMEDFLNVSKSEFSESDENTAATKSILKNKIPKPKPYLLGENMAFGLSNGVSKNDERTHDSPVLTAVSLINKQLQSERRHSDDKLSSLTKQTDKIINKSNAFRTIDSGPSENDNLSDENYVYPDKSQRSSREPVDVNHVKTVKNKFNILQMSPVQGRPKTRKLRDSELTYFGVDHDRKKHTMNQSMYSEKRLSSDESAIDDLFHSVRLIQKISNSVCNSEAESEEAPDYQNVPFRPNYAPVPTPRLRSKYEEPNQFEEIHILKPIIEHNIDMTSTNDISQPTTRRPRLRRQEEITTPSNRSLSEPPKKYRDSLEKSHRLHYQSRSKKYDAIENDINENINDTTTTKKHQTEKKLSENHDPLYANLGIAPKSKNQVTHKRDFSPRRSMQRESRKREQEERKNPKSHKYKEEIKEKPALQEHTENNTLKKNQHNKNKHAQVNKDEISQHWNGNRRKNYDDSARSTNKTKDNNNKHTNEQHNTRMKQDLRSRSSQRHSMKTRVEDVSTDGVNVQYRKISTENNPIQQVKETSTKHIRRSSNEKSCTRNESPKALQNRDANTTEYSLKSMQIKFSDSNKSNRDSNWKRGQRMPRKKEYIINYDDKNGTMSSVRKIQPVPVETSSKKKLYKESINESPKENLVLKNKTINKIALLQIADHPRNPNGMSNPNRKWKTKVNVQRSCQLL